MNYFEFYGLETKFFIDEANLKKVYFQKSKEFHPDFFQHDEEKYEEALTVSSTNNAAYKALKSFSGRLKYILESIGILAEKNDLPQTFLMEMMDINEAIMELQMGGSENDKEKIAREVEEQENYFLTENRRLAKLYDSISDKGEKESILLELKENYLKQKYVLRMKESLDKFASL